jgi:NADH dehydrogenase
VLWAAGVEAAPLAGLLAQASGAAVDRSGRVAVAADLTLPGHPEVFAIGDMVALEGVPGVAQAALQEGAYVAKVICLAARRQARAPISSAIATRAAWRSSAAAGPSRT